MVAALVPSDNPPRRCRAVSTRRTDPGHRIREHATVTPSTDIAYLAAGPIEYRFDRRGPRTVLFLHGGHMHAGIPLGEEPFADEGCSVLVPSRPGYGRTPLTARSGPEDFAHVVAALVRHVGIDELHAVIGISAGGRYAIAFAARYPTMAARLILQSSISWLPWPDTKTRFAARLAFNPITERATWSATRLLLKLAPGLGLAGMLGNLSTDPGRRVLAHLDAAERAELIALFSSMQSGRGFGNDLATALDADLVRAVGQPTLVMASRSDGSVPFDHSVQLARLIPTARLFVSDAPSHLLWFGGSVGDLNDTVRGFLA